MDAFKEHLITALHELRMTRSQLSLESGISTTTLTRWLGHTNLAFGYSTLNLRRLMVWINSREENTSSLFNLRKSTQALLQSTLTETPTVSQEILNTQNEINEMMIESHVNLHEAAEAAGIKSGSLRAALSPRNHHLTVERVSAIRADLEAHIKQVKHGLQTPLAQRGQGPQEEMFPIEKEDVSLVESQGFSLNEERLRGLFKED